MEGLLAFIFKIPGTNSAHFKLQGPITFNE